MLGIIRDLVVFWRRGDNVTDKETLSLIYGEYKARVVRYLYNHSSRMIAVSVPERETPKAISDDEDAAKKPGILKTIRGIFNKGLSEKDDSQDVWKIPDDEDTDGLTWDISAFTEGMDFSREQEEAISATAFQEPMAAANAEHYEPVSNMAQETKSPGKSMATLVRETVMGYEQERSPLDGEDTGANYLPEETPELKPRRTNPFSLAKIIEPQDKCNMFYMPHQLIAVWSPDGWCKSFTAFNLAALAAAKGFDTALVNYDLLCPELDIWFGIKQTGLTDHGCDDPCNMGVVTFEGFRPELMLRFLKMRAYGIRYLPAGNKLGNIGTPNGVPIEPLEQTLKVVYSRNTKGKPAITIVDAGRPFEDAPTLAALRQAAIVLIPTDGSPASSEIARQQIEELRRLGYNQRFIEVLFATPGRKAAHICQERCSLAFDWATYLIDREAMKPQCLRLDGRRAWEVVLNQLATSSGNVFRRL